MRFRLKQTAMAFLCLMLAALLFCPAAGANDGEYYPIRVENPEGLRLFFVRSDIKDGDLVVFGKVRRSRLPVVRVASTLNVSITGRDGKIIAERSVKYAPRVLTRHKMRNDGRFYTRFDSVPEQGAVIHVGGKRQPRNNAQGNRVVQLSSPVSGFSYQGIYTAPVCQTGFGNTNALEMLNMWW